MFIDTFKFAISKIEKRFADGRKFVAGDNVTPADFRLLSVVTQIYKNTGLKYDDVKTQLAAIYEPLTNVQRVCANIEALGSVAQVVAALEPSLI